MIEVQHVTKRYGRVTAVDDVSFRVERGEILGFLGPNGAGKTTTMRILTGYMPAIGGQGASSPASTSSHSPLEAKRRTGYLPETPPLYPDMTVREYLDFVGAHQGRPARRAQVARHERHEEDARRRHGRPRTAGSCRRATGSASGSRRRSSTTPRSSSSTSRPPASTRSRSSRRGSSSAASPATTRSSSARTSCPRSRRPASASSSSTRAGSSRSTRPTT